MTVSDHDPVARDQSRISISVTGALVVIVAVIAAPQFILTPSVLVGMVGGGVVSGGVVVIVTRVFQPSRVFLLLLMPLFLLGIGMLQAETALSRPALLVGISAFIVGGALSDAYLSGR